MAQGLQFLFCDFSHKEGYYVSGTLQKMATRKIC